MYGIGGSSTDNVFAVGFSVYHYDGVNWQSSAQLDWSSKHDVWVNSKTDAYTVLDQTVYHFDGQDWTSTKLETDMQFLSLRGVWASGEQDVFVVGYKKHDYSSTNYHSYIGHYDGVSWTEMSTGDEGSLKRVWGSSGTDVFAVGPSGIFHYGGQTFELVNTGYGYEKTYSSVWGLSESDIFFVGAGSTVLHFNGEAWNEIYTGINQTLTSIWGRSLVDVYAVGQEGDLFHFDGTTWENIFECDDVHFSDVWVSPDKGVFIAGYDHEDYEPWEPFGVILYDVDR